jgi:acetyl-CoA synthetase
VRAIHETGTKGAVLSTFSDTISESVAERLIGQGIAPLAGIDAGLAGVQAAVDVGDAWCRPVSPPLLDLENRENDGQVRILDEAESKALLGRHGVPVPPSKVVRGAPEAAAAAEKLGFPVVVKALGIAHKTEAGGLRLGLGSAEEVSSAIAEISHLSGSFLVEKMIDEVVAELIVGVAQDDQFGPYLLIGEGGILVELMKDSVCLLLPVDRERVMRALAQLKCARLFDGFRGRPRADLGAAAEAVLAVAKLVEEDPSSIVELDINPLMLLAEGRGVVAADALIGRWEEKRCVTSSGSAETARS